MLKQHILFGARLSDPWGWVQRAGETIQGLTEILPKHGCRSQIPGWNPFQVCLERLPRGETVSLEMVTSTAVKENLHVQKQSI